MTIPSLPEEQPKSRPIRESEQIPSAVPQSLMTAVSVIMVLGLILGSASAVIFLTDFGLNFAVLLGLIVAVVLVIAWFLVPARTTRDQGNGKRR